MSEKKSSAKIADFQQDRKNANRGTQRGLAALDNSLRKYGAGRSVLVDRNNRVIAGNKTIERAADIGLDDVIVVDSDGTKLVAVRRTDLDLETDSAARELAYADNRVAELDLDFDPLTIAADLEAGLDLSGLWDDTELAVILEAAELAAEYDTNLGQLWQLGRHRLIIGDCTDRAVVDAVMDGVLANLYITDPPYGVSYADKNEYLNAVGRGNRIQVPIQNDHLGINETAEKVWRPAFKNAYDFCDNQASFYLFMPQGGDQMMMMMMMSEHWIPRHELIWLKNNHVLGRADYAYKHEPILYGWKRKGTHRYYGGFQTSVLEFNKPQKSDLHPTTKPLALIERLVSNNTESDNIVLDSFLGSGTTLIACENLGRVCRAVEIDPGYAAVSIHRWAQLTGNRPHLLNT